MTKETEVDISGLDKAAVIAALYNASRPQGLGFLQYQATPMTVEDAAPLVGRYLDYVQGRVMKVQIAEDATSFDAWLYDRDSGYEAAAKAVQALRDNQPERIAQAHHSGVRQSAAVTREMMGRSTEWSDDTDSVTVTLGLSDVADVLAPAVEAAESTVDIGTLDGRDFGGGGSSDNW